MRLVGARITGYRGIDEVDVPLGVVTVLIGANGAGKSSVLEAFGYKPAEEGARGRNTDYLKQPPEVGWFFQPSNDRAAEREMLATAVSGEVPGEAALVRSAVDHMKRFLCAYRDADGFVFAALNTFAMLIDADERVADARRDALLRAIDRLPKSVWTDRVRRAVSAKADPPMFIVLGASLQMVELKSPALVSMTVSADDISPMLFSWIRRIANAAFEPIARDMPEVAAALLALDEGYLGPARNAGLVDPILELLNRRLRDVLPDFLSRQGSVVITVRDGPDGPVGEAARLVEQLKDSLPRHRDDLLGLCDEIDRFLSMCGESIDLHLEGDLVVGDGVSTYAYSRLGTGTRRWVCGAVDEAARCIEESLASVSFTDEERRLALQSRILPLPETPAHDPRLRLVDEPVEGLEPRAHGEIVGWLRERAAQHGETLVMSAHHASVLRAASTGQDLVVVGVHRSGNTARTSALGPALLTSLQSRFAELGITREELLFLARALLIVEGSDDVKSLHAIYGDELNRRGVIIHALGGCSAKSIVEAFSHSAYGLLRLPTWVMLDSTRDESLSPKLWCARDGHQEGTRAVAEAIGQLSGALIRPLAFEPNDISMGFSLKAYKSAFPRGAFPDESQFSLELQQCVTGAEVKAKIIGWAKPATESGVSATFSKHVLPVLVHHAAVRRWTPEVAASEWFKFTMKQFFDELKALGMP